MNTKEFITKYPTIFADTNRKLSINNYDSVKNINFDKVYELLDILGSIYLYVNIDDFRHPYTLNYPKRGKPYEFTIYESNLKDVLATILIHKDNKIEIICNKYHIKANNLTDIRKNYSVDYSNNDMTWSVK